MNCLNFGAEYDEILPPVLSFFTWSLLDVGRRGTYILSGSFDCFKNAQSRQTFDTSIQNAMSAAGFISKRGWGLSRSLRFRLSILLIVKCWRIGFVQFKPKHARDKSLRNWVHALHISLHISRHSLPAIRRRTSERKAYEKDWMLKFKTCHYGDAQINTAPHEVYASIHIWLAKLRQLVTRHQSTTIACQMASFACFPHRSSSSDRKGARK